MAPRGSYAKGVAKRAEILDTALDIVARNGYSGATLKELADAVGLSQNGLLHYFGSKDELFTEVLRRRDEVDRAAQPDAQASEIPEGFARFVQHNADVPGLVQLFARLSNEAAEPQHPSHAYFAERYEIVRATGRGLFERLQAEGRLDAGLDADRLAVVLYSLIDGLQTQWMFDPSIDMADHVRYFFALLGVAPRP